MYQFCLICLGYAEDIYRINKGLKQATDAICERVVHSEGKQV